MARAALRSGEGRSLTEREERAAAARALFAKLSGDPSIGDQDEEADVKPRCESGGSGGGPGTISGGVSGGPPDGAPGGTTGGVTGGATGSASGGPAGGIPGGLDFAMLRALRDPRKAERPAVMPGTFDGEGNLDEFLAHFDLCVLANRWTDREAGLYLGICLDGVARRQLLGGNPVSEEGYKTLREALVTRFQPPNQTAKYKALLRTRIRKDKESLQHLSEEVSRLSRLAYPTADASTVDTMAKDRFLDALNDPTLKHWIYLSKPSGFGSCCRDRGGGAGVPGR